MSRRRRWLRWALLALASVVIVVAGYPLLVATPQGFVLDDGLFYAQIAHTLASSGRVSFDGLHDTSGFHLAWEFLLAGVSWLLGWVTWDKHVHMGAFLSLSVFALLAVAWGGGRGWAQRLVLLALGLSGHLLLETLPLAGLLIVYVVVSAPGRAERGLGWLRWIVPFAVPLVRVDAAPAMLLLAVGLAWPRGMGAVARGGVAVGAGVAAQLAATWALSGELLSVSAQLRAHALVHYASPPLAFNLWTYGAGMTARSLLLVGLMGAGIALPVIHRREAGNRRLLWLALAASAFSATHLLLSHMRYWYFVPGFVTLTYVLFRVELPAGRWRRLRRLAVVGLVALAALYLVNKVTRIARYRDVQQASWAFIGSLPDHVPPGAPIYQVDGSGRTGYFGGRPVVNGDGLVNDGDYARRMMAGTLDGYLDEEGICFVITNQRVRDGRVVDRGGLVVTDDEVIEVARTAAYGRFRYSDYVLWRVRDGRCAGGAADTTTDHDHGDDIDLDRLHDHAAR